MSDEDKRTSGPLILAAIAVAAAAMIALGYFAWKDLGRTGVTSGPPPGAKAVGD